MIRFFRSALVGAIVSWLAVAPAVADETLRALASEAEQAAAAGQTLEALDLADRFAQAVWQMVPLAFRKTALVDSAPTAFGREKPRASNAYLVDEEIHIYAEPVAFGWMSTGEGYRTDMVADVRVATAEGKIIVGHKAFAEFQIASADRNADVFLALTYVFGGLGPGDYVVTTTLTDRVYGKTAAFSLPITIKRG
ncbi:hypothetical protein [Microbaculum sp. FT89]|uniref:hypothetical protein n=1 Tax=Microbaculum sp. FT89 TaxID=3447298 RepID=UPI003F53C3ED